jgi:hypothetical protein
MTIDEERELVKNAYKGGAWYAKIKKMTDAQVHAVYIRLKQQNII